MSAIGAGASALAVAVAPRRSWHRRQGARSRSHDSKREDGKDIKRIGVLKAGIFQGCFLALFGLLFGVMALVFGSMLGGLFGAAGNHGGAGLGMGFLGGIGALIFLPILYGVMGFIGGVIAAARYNLVAGIVGGLEIDVE